MRAALLVLALAACRGADPDAVPGWRLEPADALLRQLGPADGLTPAQRHLARARIELLAAADLDARVPVREGWDRSGPGLPGALPTPGEVGLVEPTSAEARDRRWREAYDLVDALAPWPVLRADPVPPPWTGRGWAQGDGEAAWSTPSRDARRAADAEAEIRLEHALARIGWTWPPRSPLRPDRLDAAADALEDALDAAPGDPEVHAWAAVLRVRRQTERAPTSAYPRAPGLVERAPDVYAWEDTPLDLQGAVSAFEGALALVEADRVVATTPGAEDPARAARDDALARDVAGWLVALDDLGWAEAHRHPGASGLDAILLASFRAEPDAGGGQDRRSAAALVAARALVPTVQTRGAPPARSRPRREDEVAGPPPDPGPLPAPLVLHRAPNDPPSVPATFLFDPTEVSRARWEATFDAPWSRDCFPPERAWTGDIRASVDCVSIREVALYANARSARDGLAPAYVLEDDAVRLVPDADGWRLPTAAEWDRARPGRAGPTGPRFDVDDEPVEGVWPIVDGAPAPRVGDEVDVPEPDRRARTGMLPSFSSRSLVVGFRLARTPRTP